jgi:hypothetical protein
MTLPPINRRKSVQGDGALERPRKLVGPRRRVSRPAPDPGDEHIGATEGQVIRVMPPRADDDEPKQG